MNEAPLLEVRDLYKDFGKFHVLRGVSLKVRKGELAALIGPNGAGKTTFYNVVSGRYKPTRGEIIFEGLDVSGVPSFKLVGMGLLRSFQITNIFPHLSVLENVMTPLVIHHRLGFSILSSMRNNVALKEEAEKILDQVGLLSIAYRTASTLAYGDKRMVEIAIVLARKPKLVLLDEPTAGMNPEETDRIILLIKELSHKSGATFFITEHDMKVVFSIAERIFVLNQGSRLAEGSPDEIRAHPEVRRAYLGGSLDA